jgi:hypothetical protein
VLSLVRTCPAAPAPPPPPPPRAGHCVRCRVGKRVVGLSANKTRTAVCTAEGDVYVWEALRASDAKHQQAASNPQQHGPSPDLLSGSSASASSSAAGPASATASSTALQADSSALGSGGNLPILPLRIAGLKRVVQVAVGETHSTALQVWTQPPVPDQHGVMPQPPHVRLRGSASMDDGSSGSGCEGDDIHKPFSAASFHRISSGIGRSPGGVGGFGYMPPAAASSAGPTAAAAAASSYGSQTGGGVLGSSPLGHSWGDGGFMAAGSLGSYASPAAGSIGRDRAPSSTGRGASLAYATPAVAAGRSSLAPAPSPVHWHGVFRPALTAAPRASGDGGGSDEDDDPLAMTGGRGGVPGSPQRQRRSAVDSLQVRRSPSPWRPLFGSCADPAACSTLPAATCIGHAFPRHTCRTVGRGSCLPRQRAASHKRVAACP